MPTYSVPSGYTYAAGLTVTGGNASVTGSTSTPTTSGVDYVVQVHASGGTASAIWSGISDKSALSDFSVWWWNGSAWTQIDCDVDQKTFGAWSATNILLWFKLQATLAASPATDTNYMLAWGQAGTITTKQTWTNIYPFSDDFPGSSLGGTWTTYGTVGAVTVASSLVTISLATSGLTAGLFASPTYGTGYMASMYGTLPIAVQEACIQFESGGTGDSGVRAACGSDVPSSATAWGITNCANGFNSAFTGISGILADNASHVFSIARDTTQSYGFVDIFSAINSTDFPSVSIAPGFFLWSSGTSQSMQADWIKVRPWISTEPSVAIGAIFPTQGTIYLASTSRSSWSSAQTVLQIAAPSGGPLELLRLRISVEDQASNSPFGVQLYTTTGAVTWTNPTNVAEVPALIRGVAGAAVTAWGTSVSDGSGAVTVLEEGANTANGYTYLPVPGETLVVPAGGYLAVKLLGTLPSATWDISAVWREVE